MAQLILKIGGVSFLTFESESDHIFALSKINDTTINFSYETDDFSLSIEPSGRFRLFNSTTSTETFLNEAALIDAGNGLFSSIKLIGIIPGSGGTEGEVYSHAIDGNDFYVEQVFEGLSSVELSIEQPPNLNNILITKTETNAVGLKINRMSEATLAALRAQGKIEPNQLFMTPDNSTIGSEGEGGGGGAEVTLNGVKTASASFYAPIEYGANDSLMVARGAYKAPEFIGLTGTEVEQSLTVLILADDDTYETTEGI